MPRIITNFGPHYQNLAGIMCKTCCLFSGKYVAQVGESAFWSRSGFLEGGLAGERARFFKQKVPIKIEVCGYADQHWGGQSYQVTCLRYEDEKTEAIKELYEIYDRDKIISNSGISRICENCNKECLATLYCEFCIRDYLKANFSNWTSGNNDIDNLIQKCQLETIEPDGVIEWIPYNDLQNIKYLTKGSFSEIYTAVWIDGGYEEWNSKKQQLVRFGIQRVILKRLENVENANQRWFEEAKSHFNLSKLSQIVQCYGLTQDPLNGNYMLVIDTAKL
ncbi:hypothetical protein GLOIN_2v1839524 [Rhizophagus irregularis DAOM 181602=DAOM 197198]|uniref:Protein kinase domain-containing protein n=1 Tax=Rhizophagus irregularis (strain DAOM 181602 / DAOM 197198 / MUCL 43194) TaxID=747089 RepID=A0A2P4Q8Y7_RHIID|nr:hypothetical protein GLOIN_2v1839524 [Rhizophagus irregularis DAOM 181602=DAOM 197198]POG74104.1 hypothetical protein GLOIN_2v1839524 [Rhizophagus irregularis DAOM 181602=DAOM 197198]|eukprot:XP_025180970.1 hypothetical protein GLOIN_2v1839524 [Rhizophagus irregularis DAOM 181602=DAOM 197198]